MSEELDLTAAEPMFYERARQAIIDRDAGEFLFSSKSNQHSLRLVWDNVGVLREAGIYEACLLGAFTGAKINHWHVPDHAMSILFKLADRERLREASDPLPGNGPFRIYRGVSGIGRARRLRGFSWTGSLDRACWFASRFNLAHPHVLVSDVNAADVLAFHNGRNEQEFIIRPAEFSRLTISADDIRAGDARESARMQARRDEWLASVQAVAQ